MFHNTYQKQIDALGRILQSKPDQKKVGLFQVFKDLKDKVQSDKKDSNNDQSNEETGDAMDKGKLYR